MDLTVPKYLSRTASDGLSLFEDVWEVREDGSVRKYGVTGDQTWREEQLSACFPGSTFHELKLAPGQFYPRMARPRSTRSEESPGLNPETSATFRDTRAASTGNLHALIERLQHICRVVHPQGRNLRGYGHETRNLLILACTEVEAQWKGIMKANGVPDPRNTKCYVKLAPAMKLEEYRVRLTWYPWLKPISPFRRWTESASSQSLPWYDAYNLVKHDREGSFPKATLETAIHALTGCFVILCAQYGWDFALRDKYGERAFFQLVHAPKWPAEEIYTLGEFGQLQRVPYFDLPPVECRP